MTASLMALFGRFGVTAPAWLWLLPLALLPLAASAQTRIPVPALAMVPADGLSRLVDAALTLAGMAAIGFLVLALAGPHLVGESLVRTGEGAQISLLIDRSGSMNETFAGRQPSGPRSRRPPPRGGSSKGSSAAGRTISSRSRRFRPRRWRCCR